MTTYRIQCDGCGKRFIAFHHCVKFCSDKCRKTKNRKTWRDSGKRRRIANRELTNEQSRQSYHRRRDIINAERRLARQLNPEVHREKDRVSYRKNIDNNRKNSRKYYAENAEKKRAYDRSRSGTLSRIESNRKSRLKNIEVIKLRKRIAYFADHEASKDKAKQLRKLYPERFHVYALRAYWKNPEKARQISKKRAIELLVADKLVKNLGSQGSAAFTKTLEKRKYKRTEKDRQRAREYYHATKHKQKRDRNAANNRAMNDYRRKVAALRLVRELKASGIKALL